MRYVIFGAGAVGGGIGARLAEHGYEAVLIARGNHLAAIQQHGVYLRTPEEDRHIDVAAVGHPSEVDWRPDDIVLLCMKTQDTEDALDDLRSAAGTSVPVICAQNGMENERIAARRFSRVYSMMVQMPANYLTPGEIVLNGLGVSGVLPAGRYPSGVDPLIEEVCHDLAASKFDSWADPNPQRLKYTKLLWNLQNAVQALFEPSDEVDKLRERLRGEAMEVYAAAGIDTASADEFAEITKRLELGGTVRGFVRAGGSTWQSVARGAGSVETDYLNGEIALLGTLHGVPTPLNRAIQDRMARLLAEGQPPRSVSVQEFMATATAQT